METREYDLEASDLGLRPGDFPHIITLPEGHPYAGESAVNAGAKRHSDGDTVWVEYLCLSGKIIRVFND